MKESIYTIPISEVFEPKCGCPLCTLHATLEERWVEYITGAAMMEPDVREETNRRGFCRHHLEQMMGQRNRLSVALMLQTRLAYLDGQPGAAPAGRRMFGKGREPQQEEDSCFVCWRIGVEEGRVLDNLVSVWAKQEEFRALYSQQECLCYPHSRALAAAGQRGLRGAQQAEFLQATSSLDRAYLGKIKADVDAFCNLFDYRNAGAQPPAPEVAAAVERAVAYLCGGIGK